MKKKTKRIDIYKIEKGIRSEVIKGYMKRHNIRQAVCFSCGNASSFLKKSGVKVLDISPSGDLTANRWFSIDEVKQFFPSSFDATSGHLPLNLLREIAANLAVSLKDQINSETRYEVLSGSGETVLCLKLAFPDVGFVPIYDNSQNATAYCEEAPLNDIVKIVFKKTEIL